MSSTTNPEKPEFDFDEFLESLKAIDESSLDLLLEIEAEKEEKESHIGKEGWNKAYGILQEASNDLVRNGAVCDDYMVTASRLYMWLLEKALEEKHLGQCYRETIIVLAEVVTTMENGTGITPRQIDAWNNDSWASRHM